MLTIICNMKNPQNLDNLFFWNLININKVWILIKNGMKMFKVPMCLYFICEN